MSITDELRKEARGLGGYVYTSEQAEHLTAIADRIDEEHESKCKEARDEGERIRHLIDCAKVWERYLELPKDADNVPWSVGDRDEDGNEVIALKLAPDGWYVIAVGEWPYRPESKRHYHTPAVEDVLREFADLVRKERVELATIGEDTIAEYAAKLRLAEEDA